MLTLMFSLQISTRPLLQIVKAAFGVPKGYQIVKRCLQYQNPFTDKLFVIE